MQCPYVRLGWWAGWADVPLAWCCAVRGLSVCAGGNHRGTPGAVGKGAPSGVPPPGSESAVGRPYLGVGGRGVWLAGLRMRVRFLARWVRRWPSGRWPRGRWRVLGSPARPGWLCLGLLASWVWVGRAGHNWAVHSMTSRRAGWAGLIVCPLAQLPMLRVIHPDHGTDLVFRKATGMAARPVRPQTHRATWNPAVSAAAVV
jgi:hypothetical protein